MKTSEIIHSSLMQHSRKVWEDEVEKDRLGNDKNLLISEPVNGQQKEEHFISHRNRKALVILFAPKTCFFQLFLHIIQVFMIDNESN